MDFGTADLTPLNLNALESDGFGIDGVNADDRSGRKTKLIPESVDIESAPVTGYTQSIRHGFADSLLAELCEVIAIIN